jgi:hypothetical protein
LFAFGCLALLVISDVVVVGDGQHERGDTRSEAPAEIGDVGCGFLDGVVQGASGDHVIGRVGVVEQRRDLGRVLDERGAVDVAVLA